MQTDLGNQIWRMYKTPDISEMLKESFGGPKKPIKKPSFAEPKKNTSKRNVTQMTEHDIIEGMDVEANEPTEHTTAKNITKKPKKGNELIEMFKQYVMFVVMEKIDKKFVRSNGKEEEEVNDTNDSKKEHDLYEQSYNQIIQDFETMLTSAIRDMRSSGKEPYVRFVTFVVEVIPGIVNFEIEEKPISKTHICYFSQVQYKGNQGNNGNTTVRMILDYSPANKDAMEDRKVVGEKLKNMETFISRTWAPLVTAFVTIQHAGSRIYGEAASSMGLDKIKVDRINFEITSKLISFITEDAKKQDGIIKSEMENLKAAMTTIYNVMSQSAKKDLAIKEKAFYERWLK